jgi:hypothetical protein
MHAFLILKYYIDKLNLIVWFWDLPYCSSVLIVYGTGPGSYIVLFESVKVFLTSTRPMLTMHKEFSFLLNAIPTGLKL